MNFDTDVNEHQHIMNENIEKLQNTTDIFDISEVKDVHLFFLYTINQKLESFKRIDVKLNRSTLTKNDLLSSILKNKKEDGRKFNITGLYKYNFTETNLADFLNNNTLSNCFTTLSKVDDIQYEPTIELFHDYSSLFIVLQNEKSAKTKKQLTTTLNKTIRKV